MNLTRSYLGRLLVAPSCRFYSTSAFNVKEHKQFVIFGYDGTDSKALERRLAARPAHFERAKEAKAQGKFAFGGAILDKEGKMIGSVMFLKACNEEEAKKYIEEDPYVLQKVWERYEIKPFAIANLD